MAPVVKQKRRPRTASEGRSDGQTGREQDRLVARARVAAAEARRLEARLFERHGAEPTVTDQARDFRRRALLMKQEIQSLIAELNAIRGGVDREIRAVRSQAVAINAYARCRKIGMQYARDARRSK
jgi:hypothetical protein